MNTVSKIYQGRKLGYMAPKDYEMTILESWIAHKMVWTVHTVHYVKCQLSSYTVFGLLLLNFCYYQVVFI